MNKAIYRLMAGFRKFKDKNFIPADAENSKFQRLVSEGQTPKTLLIGCSDSRVDPAILTGAEPGELFVVRNVANLVPPCEPSMVGFHGTSSALEFAVVNLKVDNIVVLGHRQCGGIQALMSNATNNNTYVRQWMTIAEEARKNVLRDHPNVAKDAQLRLAEMESIKVSLKNLQTFPFIEEAVRDRQLNIIGVYFDLEEGELWEYDNGSAEFRRLEI